MSSRLHDARKRGYVPYNDSTFNADDQVPPGFNALPCPIFEDDEDAYDRCDIYVGDLPPNTSDADLYNIFEKYGSIAGVHNTWGAFAFVVFDTIESACRALQDASAPSFRGQILKVSRCSSSVDRKKKNENMPSASKNRSPKDWTCPECNQSVFKWRQKCFFCDTPRPNSEITQVFSFEELSDDDKTNADILAKFIRDRLYREDKEWLPIDHIGGWLSQVDSELRSIVTKLGGFAAYLKAMSNVFELSTWNPCETSPFQHTSGHVQRWIRITDSAKKAIQDESTALVVLRDC